MDLLSVFLISILIESIWETIRVIITAFQDKKANDVIAKVGAMVVSLLVCLNYRIDLLYMLGFADHIPLLGIILTGILVSRGSNFVHDLLQNLQNKKNIVTFKAVGVESPSVTDNTDNTKVK